MLGISEEDFTDYREKEKEDFTDYRKKEDRDYSSTPDSIAES